MKSKKLTYEDFKIEQHILECRPIFHQSDRPTGDLKDWLIKKGLNPKKYIKVSAPHFLIFYLSTTGGGTYLKSMSCSVVTYKLSDINIKDMEEYSDTIYIYKPDYAQDDILRIFPIVTVDDYKRWLRARKLERVLWQED